MGAIKEADPRSIVELINRRGEVEKGAACYIATSEAWYGTPEVMLGRTESIGIQLRPLPISEDQGVFFEFVVDWKPLSQGCPARLCVYDEAWEFFSLFPAFVKGLSALQKASGPDVTPSDFVALLEGLGFNDVTQRESPYPNRKPICPTCKREAE